MTTPVKYNTAVRDPLDVPVELLLPIPDWQGHVHVGLGGMYYPTATLPELYLDASLGWAAWPCEPYTDVCDGPALGLGYEIWPHVPVHLQTFAGLLWDDRWQQAVGASTLLSIGFLAY